LLRERGIEAWQIDDVLLTHVDHDHWRPTWCRVRDLNATVHVHRSHKRANLFNGRARVHIFEHGFETRWLRVEPLLMAHDEAGVVVYRFELAGGGRLGYATDVGHVSSDLVDHLHGVDVLAIESNYDPEMQMASGRPPMLKQRIMGGRGHLSNGQAFEAVRFIEPKSHVVLLHLSRECNTPGHVESLHEGASYGVTITDQFQPTEWIPCACAAPF
ncbi:MAG: hypothetical protein KDA28_01115, partial [Phycisphaerales bacterium]|nr:hypothetical protein [Phycisphaerales bacterium]